MFNPQEKPIRDDDTHAHTHTVPIIDLTCWKLSMVLK